MFLKSRPMNQFKAAVSPVSQILIKPTHSSTPPKTTKNIGDQYNKC